ncbi:MAG TPA: M20 family metallopeptidase [Ktedonobacteraceae bacterium]|nr:M20 family metallopeptidase [Ktedonobacteraceae bacterium]
MQTYAQDYLPTLQTYQEEWLQRLELLVNIDSGTGQTVGIQQIMGYLQRWLEELGLAVTLHETELFGPNLVARKQGKGSLRVLLVGHVDTVYGRGAATTRPWCVEEGIAYGPGVIDMKSGVLMAIYAARALLETGFEDFGEICLVFNNDEEVGSPGSVPLLREIAPEIDVAFVLEPSRNAAFITSARKGADKYMLTVRGVPAHAGVEPHRGRSAVVELAHKLIAIHHLNTLYPGVTFNVTRLSSSDLLNVVPDMARCHIAVRAHKQEQLEMAARALEVIVAGSSIPGTHTTLERTRGRIPYQATPAITRLVDVAALEGQALGIAIVAESKGGLSDANALVEVGVPTLDSLGPIGGGMHDLKREYLRIDSLPLRGALLAGLIHHLCLA